MKKTLQLVLLFALAISAKAATIYDTEITVTNTPTTNGMTLVVNGSTRTFTNSVAAPSTQIVTNNSIGGITTNVFQQLAAYPFTGIRSFITATNKIRLSGTNTITASLTGNWGSIADTSSSGDSMQDIRVPMSAESAAVRTNKASLLITGLGTYSTNALDQNSTAASQLVGTTNAQTIGNKTVTNSTFSGGTLTNNAIKNASSISGTVSTLTNGGWKNPNFTNATSYDFTVYRTTNYNLRVETDDEDTSPLVVNGDGNNPVVQFFVGGDAVGDISKQGVYRGDGSGLSNLTAIAYSGQLTNKSFYGTNIFTSDISFPRFDITTLASGNNSAIPHSNHVYLKLSGNGAAANINGIAAGRDGQILIIKNGSGYDQVFVNDSGVDPVAANRIYTPGGGNYTNGAGYSTILICDASVSRWDIIGQLSSGAGGSGEANAGSNLGGGYHLYDSKSGVNLQFNTITNGSGVTISSNSNVLTISATGSQTPWTTNVDGAGYDLTGAGTIMLTNQLQWVDDQTSIRYTNSSNVAGHLSFWTGNEERLDIDNDNDEDGYADVTFYKSHVIIGTNSTLRVEGGIISIASAPATFSVPVKSFSQVSFDVETTDATLTTVGTLLVASQGVCVEATFVGVDTATGDMVRMKRIGQWKNGGGLVQKGTFATVGTDFVDTGASAWAVSASDDSSENIYLEVTGDTATTIKWHVTVTVSATDS